MLRVIGIRLDRHALCFSSNFDSPRITPSIKKFVRARVIAASARGRRIINSLVSMNFQ